MKVRAHYLDGSTDEAPIGARAQVEFERKFDVFYADAFSGKNESAARVERVYFLTWAALRYAGRDVPDDFDEWLSLVDDAEPLIDPKGAKGGNPTKRARSRAAS